MNRPDIMARLLQHGPLSFGEATRITGWSADRCDRTIQHMRKQGEVRREIIAGQSKYRLTNTARVDALEGAEA